MSKTYDKVISIQRINETTEKWEDVYKVHADINKTRSDSKYLEAGAIQGKRTLTFELRYFKNLENIAYNIQLYRLVYQGVPFTIKDYDDFKLSHKTVKIVGVSY